MTTFINIDFGSSDFKIPGLESKFDFVGVPNSFVRCFEDELNRFEITVLYQLLRWHSWSNSGVVLRGLKWIYKSVAEMIQDAFRGIKSGKLYRALRKLVELGFILREQLHREHKGDLRACDAYNRRFYYSPVIDRVMESITSTLAEQSPQTLETLGFSKTENQVFQNETTDFSKQKNITHTTYTSKLSLTPPLTPLGERESEQVRATSVTSQKHQNRQEKGNPIPVSQKTINSQVTQFADVVKRPARVEQKVNKTKVVQEPVQTENVQEAVQVEVVSPESSKRVKKNRTPKGTKPNKSFDGPWNSLEQYQKFYRALVKALPIVANSHSPEGLANKIIGQLKRGELHSYWDDFINGLPIGTSTQHEWEVEPGVPHPMFIEYLAEKLIQGNNSQTREQAIDKALDIANSPKRAMFFWKECKISLGNVLDEAQRHRNLGVNALSTPLWTKERPEPTLEEAVNAGNKIALINGSTQAAIEAAKNRQIEGGTGQVGSLPCSTENTPIESDPWLDEPKQKKPKISDFAGEKLKGLLSKGFGKTKVKAKSEKRYSQPDDWRRQPLRIEEMSFSSINKALSDPILREELTPQLMLSDYQLIRDEIGRVLRIEDKLP